jgi:hypothetical protein
MTIAQRNAELARAGPVSAHRYRLAHDDQAFHNPSFGALRTRRARRLLHGARAAGAARDDQVHGREHGAVRRARPGGRGRSAARACRSGRSATAALEVVANLKNSDIKPVHIKVQCVFADDQGLPVGGEYPWQPLDIASKSTEVVRFTAPIVAAKRYVIRVRTGREGGPLLLLGRVRGERDRLRGLVHLLNRRRGPPCPPRCP